MTSPQYGAEVQPNAPVQDMNEIDVIAGSPGRTRDEAPGNFTGGMGGQGLGGMAEPAADTKVGVDSPGF